MRLARRQRPRNIGREDRLVRACVAFSLLLLGGFAALTAGHISTFVVGFAAGFGYFALTAALAWDPFYAHQRIDTRPEIPHAVDPLIDADPFAATELRPMWGGSPVQGERGDASDLANPNSAEGPSTRSYTSVVDLTETGAPHSSSTAASAPRSPASTGAATEA